MTLHTMTSMALVPKTVASKLDKPIGLLATKLAIPPSRPTLVPRDCLIAKLNNGLRRGCQLILVSAPAGAGKTALLSSWLRHLAAPRIANQDSTPLRSPLGLAWLTLDREDDQPLRFWTYLISALQTIDADLGGEAQRLLAAPRRPPIRIILSSLLNDLAAYSNQIVLVLDDFEAITASSIHKGIVFIVDHAPAQFHMVLSSRTDPALPLARFRAHDQLAELHGTELDFTIDETAAFLSGMTGMTWRNEHVWALHARTEGWIAGLQIAGLELQRLLADAPVARIGWAIARFIDGFSGNHQDIRDFLEAEVLDRQPRRVQAFLLLTSILERLNGSLCDAVTGQTGSQELLEQLGKANLFVVPLDGAPPGYRYHVMFAEMLWARLRQTRPGLAPILHRRAAEWYEGQGDTTQASTHRLQAAQMTLRTEIDPRSWAQIAPIGVAGPMVAGSDVIVVDQPSDDALRRVRESATHYPASERAMLLSLTPIVQERVPGAEMRATDPVLDQGSQIVQLVEQLTQRELEILRLIAEGLSYMAISNRLVIGLNTVRFHVKNIYGKLEVHQRTQAIARAKKLRLLLP
jgi:ATP/maltotriose-dependent transcriptional regulator MalT